ncbi:MAG: hypothetical protein C0605_02170 [Hyphomicrobiales bacterium]|nr:MAG: hypothetical protein C0605_02170 [Hyphomicrobiales bacterium]
MTELMRTADPVLISAVEAILAAAGITCVVFDANMSVMEGSIGALPRRIMVGEEHLLSAKRVLSDAGVAEDE